MNIATVICYCTNDYRFIGKCIAEAKLFSSQIIVPVCDHFFNGSPENRALLDHTYAEHKGCEFIEFAFSADRLYSPYLRFNSTDEEWIHLWHATARYIGFLHLRSEIDYVLFLDCDEIIEGSRFLKWLESGKYRKWNAMRLLCYYYVLRPEFRATQLQDLTLFARKNALFHNFFFHPDERYALYRYVSEPKQEGIRGVDLKPMIHHYSWVRPENECLHKAATWGHRSDADWPKIIKQAFSEKKERAFFGRELEFECAKEIYFNPLEISVPEKPISPQLFDSVKKINHRDLLRMELDVLL